MTPTARTRTEGCARRARARWRSLAGMGALGLLCLALLLGGAPVAYARSGAGSAVAQAKTSVGVPLQPQEPCSANPDDKAPACPTPTPTPRQPCVTGPPQPGQIPCPPNQTDNLTGEQCRSPTRQSEVCNNLATIIQQWTRWAAWLLGGFCVLWILIAFFRSSEPFFVHSAEGPWRRIWLRIIEAGAIFLIAWRIGDIAVVIEGILWENRNDAPTTGTHSPGLVAPPQQAISELLGLATGVLIQVFLIYLAPRVIVQLMTGIGMIVSGRLGTGFPSQTMYNTMFLSVINSIFQLLALGVAIFYAPTVLIWIFALLSG